MGNPPHWFRAKPRGGGWGLPMSWQGWAIFAGYWVVVGAVLFLMKNPSPGVPAILGAATLVLVAVYWWKGEPTSWRRRAKD